MKLRKPSYLSFSSMSLFHKDADEYIKRHLAPNRPPKLPQEQCMAIGSAFDARVKSHIYDTLFGNVEQSDFAQEKIFEAQVEPHNRDWAWKHGKFVFDAYVNSGAYDELIAELDRAENIRMEFSVQDVIHDIPFLGKPDLAYEVDDVRKVLDWKVNGYCSRSATSPCKNYRMIRDCHGQNSRGNGKPHKGYDPDAFFEESSVEFATQLVIYGWLIGEPVGESDAVYAIDQLVNKPTSDGRLLRVAQHRSRISREHQTYVLSLMRIAWHAISSGHIYYMLSREESDQQLALTLKRSEALVSDGSPEENYFNEIARPTFRW